MLQAHNLHRSFGPHDVLCGVTFQISRGEKVGLIGRNGCGKSTLLAILAGRDRPDRGGLAHTVPGRVIGEMPQIPDYPSGAPVGEILADPSAAEPPPEWEVRRVMAGLGLGDVDLERPAGTLSGGEGTRLMLARLLLSEADLLLLDEPTNFLDLGMLAWLEGYLARVPKACLIVSHDRRFLDRTVSRILDLEGGVVREYSGNYAFYAEEKEQELRRQEALFRRQQAEIAHLEAFIQRQLGLAHSIGDGPKRGRDHYGRVAEKVARRAKAAQTRIDRMERVERPRDAGRIQAEIVTRAGSRRLIEAQGVAIRFGDRTLVRDLDLDLLHGERWGVIGPNGAGKSTLLRVLLGYQEPTAGTVRRAERSQIVYLPQEPEEAPKGTVVLDAMLDVGGLSQTEARNLLACYLFRGDDVFKRVGSLSAGERMRLALARASVAGAALLVLDEPTSHLDIAARERLEVALSAYPGALLLVSHDRYLLDRLVDRLLVLGTEQPLRFLGRYTEWEERSVGRELPGGRRT